MTRLRFLLPGVAALGLLSAVVGAQSQRIVLPAGTNTNAGFKTNGADSVLTTDMTTLTPQQLVQALLGPGVTASNIVFNGAPVAAGTFSSGLPVCGLDSGIILSSGNISSVVGPNTGDATSTSNGTNGDADLAGLTTSPTYDACTLEFDFTCTNANAISFQYVFSSEEFNEWVNTQYNDVFGFFLNGVNIATLPGGLSVAINNVNCGNPYTSNLGGTCALFINNRCVDLPAGSFPCAGPMDCEMDGMTVVLTATGLINPGVNHIKLAIADAGDSIYDSNVFIRGQSFTCGPPLPYFPPPPPSPSGPPGLSPCGETISGFVNQQMQFNVSAQTATGLNTNAVTLSVGAVPLGLTHSPALPMTVVGQNVAATSTVTWTPTASQVGTYILTYTATDQQNEVETCTVTIHVAAAPLAASAVSVGVGYASTGQTPQLDADPPVLGDTPSIHVSHSPPNTVATLYYSFGLPVTVNQGFGCFSYVDLATFAPMAFIGTDATGHGSVTVAVPSDPGLVGFQLTLQALYGNQPGPLGVKTTNAMLVTLGV